MLLTHRCAQPAENFWINAVLFTGLVCRSDYNLLHLKGFFNVFSPPFRKRVPHVILDIKTYKCIPITFNGLPRPVQRSTFIYGFVDSPSPYNIKAAEEPVRNHI